MEENKTPETVEEQTETAKTPETPETVEKPKKAPKKKKENEFEKKYNELNDTYLRTLAEYDNYRKRTQKEKDGMFADGIVKAATSILPAIDNLERALEALGVKEIECLNKEFDPKFHNAIMHVDDEAFGENEVVEVFQKGFVYKEEIIIRHAIVKVAN